MRRVVIAPHQDDESMGCGGLLAKYPGECLVVTVTDSGPVRAAEHERALAALGHPAAVNLGFPDGGTPQLMTDLVAALDRVLAEHRPDEVYLPFPSLHQDHIATYEAAHARARRSRFPAHSASSGAIRRVGASGWAAIDGLAAGKGPRDQKRKAVPR